MSRSSMPMPTTSTAPQTAEDLADSRPGFMAVKVMVRSGGQSIGIAQAGIAVHAAGHVNGDGDRLGGVDLAEQGAHIIGQISVKADTVYCVYHQLRFPHSAGCHIWLGLQIENGNAKAFMRLYISRAWADFG